MVKIPDKRPVRFFNTTGPCRPWDHYMLPPADRLVGAQLDRYIRDNLYWVLHAPRQTGKTTFLQEWAREINAGGEAVACYVSIEACQGITDMAEAMKTIHKAVCAFAKRAELPIPELPLNESSMLIDSTMHKWAELVFPKPLIVLFDEADVLERESFKNIFSFDIKEDTGFFPNFTKLDITALFAQRTKETGQKITDEALDYIYEQSWGNHGL